MHLLKPASPTALTGTWAWSHVTCTAIGGALPGQAYNTNNSTYFNNGDFSGLIEMPKLRSFARCGDVAGPMQLWRVPGME